MILDSSPSGGEPDQPRGRSHPQRRQTKSSNGAIQIKRRNSKRGLRNILTCSKRKEDRNKRRRQNRREYREYKAWCKNYVSKQKAPEPRLRQRRDRCAFLSAIPDRQVRKRQFHLFKQKQPEKRRKNTAKLRYNKPLKVATLNVRGLIGDNAHLKKCLLVDIMTKCGYDIMLLQETNFNKNSVETLKGFEFFYSTDVKLTDASQHERAGVGIVISKELKHVIQDIKQISGRLMSVTLSSKGRNLCFSSCYAPHSGHDVEKKMKFYDDLLTHARKAKGIHFIGGDFNARLHHRYESEESALGPYIFGRGAEYLERVADCTMESRSLFLQYCLQDGLRVLNTCFRKPPDKYCTFRENTTEHGPQWTPQRYAQLDFWLVADKWRRNCKDVTARTDIFFPSDHYIVEACVVVKLHAENSASTKAPRFRQPTDRQQEQFNNTLQRNLCQVAINSDTTWSEISRCIVEVASRTLTPISSKQKQDYLSEETWQKIVDRQTAHENGDQQAVRDLSTQIKVLARRDKRIATFDSIREIPDQRERWTGIKRMKKDPQPRFLRMKKLQGEFVPPKNRAETIATYLQDKHWTNDMDFPVEKRDLILDLTQQFNIEPFNISEYDAALQTTKANKQPGPDNVVMELFKWMNHENKVWFLRLINFWWENQVAPHDLFFARVVPIYKKGDTDEPSNYRPISLLNSLYKIYMILIRQRLQAVLETSLSKTQYGFRPS